MARASRIYLPFEAGQPRIKRAGERRSEQATASMEVALVRTSPKQPGGISGSVMHAS